MQHHLPNDPNSNLGTEFIRSRRKPGYHPAWNFISDVRFWIQNIHTRSSIRYDAALGTSFDCVGTISKPRLTNMEAVSMYYQDTFLRQPASLKYRPTGPVNWILLYKHSTSTMVQELSR